MVEWGTGNPWAFDIFAWLPAICVLACNERTCPSFVALWERIFWLLGVLTETAGIVHWTVEGSAATEQAGLLANGNAMEMPVWGAPAGPRLT